MLELLWGWTIWGNRATCRKQAPSRRRLMPCVELLEDRCVPTAAIAEFPVPTANSSPFGIAAGSDGNLWFTENQVGQIGMINPTTHAISEFPIPTANSGPLGITAGPDGNLWFTEYAANQIGEINPTTHVVTQFAIPTAGSGAAAIAAGPDGNLWFTEFNANQIGEINPTTHAITEYPLPTSGSNPLGIAAGPDGNLWFAESNGNNIGAINPTTHSIGEFPIPQVNSQPYEIVAGPNGNMWFAKNGGGGVGAISTTTHVFSRFPAPTPTGAPYGIAAGADGNVWFTESGANRIGEVNVATGVVTETPLPTASAFPVDVVAGPGDTLWFTEANVNQIGEVVIPPTINAAPVNQSVIAGQSATFTATGAGFPTPTVQWEVSSNGGASFTPLANAGVYSGVTTDTLTIIGATTEMSGWEYEAVFNNGVSATPTAPATLTVTPTLSVVPALPEGTAGTSYDQTLSVVGSTTPLSVLTVNNLNAGTTGLTLSDFTTNMGNRTIVIKGTPTAAGTATFTMTVANTGGNSVTQNMTLTILPPLSIVTPSLPQGTAGATYKQAITVTGGVTPYATFTVTNFNAGGTGLTAGAITAVAASGTVNISGKPSAGGTVTFTVDVADSAGAVVTKNFTIAVNPPLVITPSLPVGDAGSLYDRTLTVTGGAVPYTTITVGSFSPGGTGLTSADLAINAATRTITIKGTPTAAGTASFTVHVVDAVGAVLNKTYTLAIHPALTITPSLPAGDAGTNYNHTLTIAGGSAPYTTVTAASFSAGKTGLTASAITVNAITGKIVINGMPTAPGTADFTVHVADSAGVTITKTYVITIDAAPTLGSLTTTQWTLDGPGYTGVIPIAAGSGPFVISSFSGIPAGLLAVVNGNTIHFTGTPSTANTYTAKLIVHDAAGAVVTKSFKITINPRPTIGNPTMTQWTTGMSGFAGVLTVAHGTGGYTIVSSSGLPTGMKITVSGATIHFTGTPTTVGSYTASVTLHDADGASVTKTFKITINPDPTAGNLTVTQWTLGKSSFTGVLALAAGTGPFHINGFSGLPAGLTPVVSGNTIRFTGTPTKTGTYTASVTVDDAAGASVTKSFKITINPAVKITTTRLPSAKKAVSYATTVHATGGTGAVTFAITAGSLPPGIKLSKTGIIAGVSNSVGSFTCTITATDAVGAKFSDEYTLSVAS